MKNCFFLKLFAALSLLLCSISKAGATDFYVSNSGTDAPANGTSIATPWKTITYAIAQASVVNGDVINVAAGNYTENLVVTKNLTFKGANAGISAGTTPGLRGAETILNGRFTLNTPDNGFTLDGFTVNVPLANAGSSNARIVNFNTAVAGTYTVTNNILDGGAYSQSVGMYCSPASLLNVTWNIKNNSFNNFNQQAINLANISGPGTISGNIFTNNPTNTFITLGSTISTGQSIKDNKFTNNTAGTSTFLSIGNSSNEISNNLIEGTAAAIGITVASTGSGQQIKQNKFTNNSVAIQAASANNNVTENFFSNSNNAFRLVSPGGNNNTVSKNSLLSTSTVVIQGLTGFVINASCNWWGTASPTVSKVTSLATVTMAPWLTAGSDTDGGIPGFQTTEVCLAPCNLQLSTTTTDETTCLNGTASVTVDAGGSGLYNYSWNTSPVQTGATATGLGNGTYIVTVRDTNGCSATKTAVVANALTGPVHNITSGINYCSIQAAVTAAAPNDVIEADAGIYNEAVITINKPLTLKGANAGISAGSTPGIRIAESVVNGEFRTSNVNGILTINGFTINAIANNGSGLNCNLGGSGTINVLNNIIDGKALTGTRGIYTGVNVIWNVEGNTIRNCKNYGILLDATGPAPTPGQGTFKGNVIAKNGSGGMIIQQSVTTPQIITENYFDSCGIVVSIGANGHKFTRNKFVGPRTAIQCIGVVVSGITYASGGNTYEENNFNNANTAISILGLSTGNTVYHNSFTHTANFLVSASTAGSQVDATCNWWNSTNPSLSKVCCTGTNMVPWLTDGTDSDSSTLGFQTTSTCAAPCALQISVSKTEASCSNSATVSVTSGGTGGPYTYSWNTSPVQTGATATNLNPGTYTVTVKDLNGCTQTASVTIVNSPLNPVHNINTGLHYCTIQSAVNDVATLSGHTIQVDPGTYTENVTTSKSLTFLGANAGTSAGRYPGVRGPESKIIGYIQNTQGVTDFTIDGFTLDLGSGTSFITQPSTITGLNSYSIVNNIFTNNSGYSNCNGLSIQSTVALTTLSVNDNSFSGFISAGAGDAIFIQNKANITLGTFSRNYFYNNSRSAIKLGSTGGNPGSPPPTSGQIISDNLFDMSTTNSFSSAAIIMYNNNNIITNNEFRGAGNGINSQGTNTNTTGNVFLNDGYAYATNADTGKYYFNALHYNYFGGGSRTGYSVSGYINSNVLDATCNWWGGTTLAANTPKVNSASVVSFIPWLTSGADTDAGTPGFQSTEVCAAPCNLQVSTSTTAATLCGNGTATVSVVSGGSGSYSYSWNTTPTQTSTTATGLNPTQPYTVNVTDLNGCTTTATATVANNLITGPVHNINTDIYYCTIQSAISDPLTLNGHTVTVMAGTYPENIISGKNITLLGANSGISAGKYAGTRGAESIIEGSIQVGGVGLPIPTGFTLDGFTIKATANSVLGSAANRRLFYSYSVASGAVYQLSNNILDGNYQGRNLSGCGSGINCAGTTGIFGGNDAVWYVSNNKISNHYYWGILVDGTTTTGTYSGNLITDNIGGNPGFAGGGIILQGSLTTGQLITDNEFSNNAPAIALGSGNHTITKNQFENGRGIYAASANNYVSENFFDNTTTYAFWLDAAKTGNVVYHNSILGGSPTTVYGSPGGIVTATCNWWGTTTPSAVATKVNSYVNYLPWLPNGIDTDGGTAGFQTTAACTVPCDLVLTATTTQPLCPGETGSVTLSVTGGSGTYTLGGDDTTSLAVGSYSYSVLDANGCTATASAVITEAIDSIAPTAVCKNITVELDGDGNASITADSINNASTDACGILSLSVNKTSFVCADADAINTVVLTVTDNNSNSSTCSATVTIEDNIAPVAVCKDVTVLLDAGGNANITSSSVNNGSSDACGIDTYVLTQSSFNCGDIGENTITLTVTDMNDNSSSCSAVVSVVDNTAPNALCQNVEVHLDASGYGSTNATAVGNLSGDMCGLLPQCLPSGPMVSCLSGLMLDKNTFDCSNVGANSVVLTVTDNNYNTSTCTATVTVVDDVAPVAICQNVTVQLNSSGVGTTSAAAVNNGSTDACGIALLSLNKTTFNCIDVGVKTVILTVKDVNNNISNCNATVTIQDNTAPVALCKNITVALDATGNASITPAQINNASTDACGIASLAITTGSTFNCSNTGTNTAILKVTDVNGNTSTCTSVVTINGGSLYGYVMLASEKIHLHYSNVQSGGIGITTSVGVAEIEKYSTVTAPGTFVQAMNIDVNEGAVVTNQIHSVATAPIPLFQTNPYTSNNDVTVPTGQTVVLNDTIYNKIKVEKYGTVIFTRPVVNIRHLDAKEFTIIKFTQCTKVRLKEHLHIKRNSKFNPDGLGVTVFAQKHVDVQEGSQVFATIYAKDEDIKVKGKANNRTTMTGLFIAKKIEKGEYTDWNANSQCGKCTSTPQLLARIIASTDVSCDDNNNGSLTIDVSGGTTPYNIVWNTSPAQYGATASNLTPGTYVATVTDALGATTTVSADVIVFTYTILATEEVNIGKNDTVFSGSVGVTKAGGKATLDGNTAVDGDDAFVIASVINLTGGSSATDTIWGVASPTTILFEGNISYSSNSDLNVANNSTVVLAATDTLRHKITIGDNATLVVSAGVLNITDRLELKKNSVIKFAQACSKVRIKGDLISGDNPTINPDDKQVIFHVNGNVTINKGADVTATIFAPNGTIQTQNATASVPSVMTGKFIGKKVFGGDYTYWYENTACPCNSGSGAPVSRVITPVVETEKQPLSVKDIKVNAYPNPFSNTTTISFTLPEAETKARLVIYDATGSIVRELFNGNVKGLNEYQFEFNADNSMPSGMYYYRLETGNGKSVVNKLILTK